MSTHRPEQSHPGDLGGGDDDQKNEKPRGRNKAEGTEQGFELSKLSPHCQPCV